MTRFLTVGVGTTDLHAVIAGGCLLRSLGIRSAAAVVLAAAGCAIDNPPTTDALLEPGAGRSVLVIFRQAGAADAVCVHRVAVDERTVAELLPGAWITVYPSPGDHVVGVERSGRTCAGNAHIRLAFVVGRDRRLQTASEDGLVAIRVDDSGRF